eukprot:566717-Pyramimonas_sp.AAC.1
MPARLAARNCRACCGPPATLLSSLPNGLRGGFLRSPTPTSSSRTSLTGRGGESTTSRPLFCGAQRSA